MPRTPSATHVHRSMLTSSLSPQDIARIAACLLPGPMAAIGHCWGGTACWAWLGTAPGCAGPIPYLGSVQDGCQSRAARHSQLPAVGTAAPLAQQVQVQLRGALQAQPLQVCAACVGRESLAVLPRTWRGRHGRSTSTLSGLQHCL